MLDPGLVGVTLGIGDTDRRRGPIRVLAFGVAKVTFCRCHLAIVTLLHQAGWRLVRLRARWGLAVQLLLCFQILAESTLAPSIRTNQAIKEMVYGGDDSFPPYEYLDRKGEPAGLNVDLIRAIGRVEGVQVRVELKPWKEVRDGLRQGKIDVTAMYRSEQRAKEVDYAIQHELVAYEMFIRRGDHALSSIQDLKGKRVLVEADTVSIDTLAKLGITNDVKQMRSEPEALEALAKREGDVAIVTQAAGRPFESRSSQIVPTGPPVLLTEYCFVTAKGRQDLIELLNQGGFAVKASGEYDRIYERWLRPDRSARYLHVVGGVLGVTLLASVLFLLWNFSLRRQVARQTQALRLELETTARAQAALAENEKILRQSQKMEAVGRLAGGVAHDFNNILTIIIAWAIQLREELTRAGKETMEVDEILAASERASGLTKQLLAFSRATPVAITQLDLSAMVIHLKSMLQRLVGEHIQVEASVPSAPVVIQSDSTLIEQVLLNLCANARDAMPNGGILTVNVEVVSLAAPNLGQLPAGDYASLTVADTGAGMDEAILGRIFDPFFTTKEMGRGTGLGLATVQGNVAKLGGKVFVESAIGRGSEFRVLLPRSIASSSPGSRSSVVAAPPKAAGGETILLVEDDESLRRASRVALERAGYRVIEAPDGEEGERVARSQPFSILITDVVMPKRGGAQMVANLRLVLPDLRVLFVSGYVNEGESLDINAPGTAFLSKPYTVPGLLEAVARLAAHEPVSPTI